MARRYISLLLVLVSLLAFASGCGNRSLFVITPHLEQLTDSHGGETRIENITDLKNAILRAIQDGVEKSVFRLYSSSNDAKADVIAACREAQDDPLGMFAVDYMLYDCVRILTYYEVTVDITYRRSTEQIAKITSINSSQRYREILEEQFLDFGEGFTAEIQYYYPEQYDTSAILTELYYSNPLKSVAAPSLTAKVYPETGNWRRILDIELTWPESAETLVARQQGLSERAEALLPELPDGEIDGISALFSLLCETVNYLPNPQRDLESEPSLDSTFTAYGALVEGSATSEGYALAFKALCDLAGIECRVIRGRWNGIRHAWNLVRCDGFWYHVDAALGDFTAAQEEYEPYSFLLRTDLQFSPTHAWTISSYPVCNGPEVEFAVEVAISESLESAEPTEG